MSNKLTIEQIIEKARVIHKDKYDYSKSVYTNNITKIEIICLTCNKPFWQTSSLHIGQKCGCPICAVDKTRTTQSIFEEKARSIHGNKYDYSKSVYKNLRTKVEIICNECHKTFWQEPHSHIIKRAGCPYCDPSRSQTQNEVIQKSKSIHRDKFDYSKVHYINNASKIEIICNKCDRSFFQSINDHVNKKRGCPFCSESNISNLETEWLDSKRISYKNRNVYITIGKKKYWVDAYIHRSKTIYEFYGDYWHGNPKVEKFVSDKINANNKKTFGELYEATMKREQELKDAGYKLITIWESDWNKQRK